MAQSSWVVRLHENQRKASHKLLKVQIPKGYVAKRLDAPGKALQSNSSWVEPPESLFEVFEGELND